jgi:alpha-tubulin suppressor-like RCC1 family protein
MPTFYSFNQNGQTYNFDDVFVPVEWFQSGNLWNWGNGTNTPSDASSPGLNSKQVSCGDGFRCVVMMDGSLWGFGNNQRGQLGDNTTTFRSSPVREFTESFDWKQVGCGRLHTCVIKTDGTLWSWGANDSGQLGLGDVAQRNIPTQIDISEQWKQVSCGEFYSAAVRADGTLWVWGDNTYGQIGDGTIGINRLSPFQIPGTDWKYVDCGRYHISAIKNDGTLWSWGKNNSGELGLGDNLQRTAPSQVGVDDDWKQVSCGNEMTGAIKTDGTLFVWGKNDFTGRLGFNNTGDVYIPTIINQEINWKYISCGRCFGAIKTDGTLWMWGSGDRGELANGSSSNNVTPALTTRNETDWKQIYIDYESTVGSVTYIDPIL